MSRLLPASPQVWDLENSRKIQMLREGDIGPGDETFEKKTNKKQWCASVFFEHFNTFDIYIYLGPKVPLTKTKTLTMNHEVQHQCVRCVELQWWMFKANPTPSPRSRGFVALWRALPQVLTDFFECGKFVWQTFRASVDTNSQHQI